VPYVAVVGDREVEKNVLTVTIRKLSDPKSPHKEEIGIDHLIAQVHKDLEGKPRRPLYTPSRLSKKAHYI
jgi:threonyl-tRNA synthetase